jgi:hypothetical protein
MNLGQYNVGGPTTSVPCHERQDKTRYYNFSTQYRTDLSRDRDMYSTSQPQQQKIPVDYKKYYNYSNFGNRNDLSRDRDVYPASSSQQQIPVERDNKRYDPPSNTRTRGGLGKDVYSKQQQISVDRGKKFDINRNQQSGLWSNMYAQQQQQRRQQVQAEYNNYRQSR